MSINTRAGVVGASLSEPHIDKFAVEFVGMATSIRAITGNKRQRECLSVDMSCKAHGVLDLCACSIMSYTPLAFHVM